MEDSPKNRFAAKNYYERLNLPRSASKKEITRAFREIAMVYHPDSGMYSESGLNEAHLEIFQLIAEAYNTLSDPKKRDVYDRKLAPEDKDSTSAKSTRYAQETAVNSSDESGASPNINSNIDLRGLSGSLRVFRNAEERLQSTVEAQVRSQRSQSSKQYDLAHQPSERPWAVPLVILSLLLAVLLAVLYFFF